MFNILFKLSLVLLISIGLMSCDILNNKELICKPKDGSLILDDYDIIKIYNWKKEFCVPYWGGDLTCVPFNKSIQVLKYEDDSTRYIKKITTLKSYVNHQIYKIEVSEHWIPSAEVTVNIENNNSIFKFKNTLRKSPRIDLNSTEIDTLKILTILDHKYRTTNEISEGSDSYNFYYKKVIGDSIVWNYRLDRYTRELTSFGDLSRIYVLDCTEQSSKL